MTAEYHMQDHPLIGYQCKITRKPQLFKGEHIGDMIIIDESDVEHIRSHFGDSTVRLIRSGYLYTQDIRPERANVRVNDDGFVTDVYYG